MLSICVGTELQPMVRSKAKPVLSLSYLECKVNKVRRNNCYPSEQKEGLLVGGLVPMGWSRRASLRR